MQEANDSNFEDLVLKKSFEKPVVVDFYADWCMPCLMLAPTIEQLAEEYKGKVEFVKVNVDSAPNTSVSYGIMSIPNVKLFRNGKVVSEFIGVMPKDEIKNWLEKNL
ncbi:MAG: thioredoxin [Candidatus Iainarchaeum archaeon]|uniref:Thioredoxin n=1 Tax=Candidatus Iainarchaeum sp. TaxID=3101447 RepID=A0A497JH65_9ARCH|nr:MAG: thioredoxin [Candidatus Diapherotrites archaeon]